MIPEVKWPKEDWAASQMFRSRPDRTEKQETTEGESKAKDGLRLSGESGTKSVPVA
jgi:hypothetical protein